MSINLERKQLQVEIMNWGSACVDTGTFDSLSEASEFVRVIEKHQSQKNWVY
jgi:glucose-1-phosphate thymidylyltransferase